jgi:hypothetical protein
MCISLSAAFDLSLSIRSFSSASLRAVAVVDVTLLAAKPEQLEVDDIVDAESPLSQPGDSVGLKVAIIVKYLGLANQ